MRDEDLYKQYLAQVNMQNSAIQQAQPKKTAGLLGDVLSIGGGALGAIGGSFLAPVAGTIAGGAVGSGAGRALANFLTGTDIGDNVASDAAFGAIGGVAGKALKIGKSAKATSDAAAAIGAAPKSGILSKIGAASEKAGNSLMSSQANLTRAQARNLGVNIPETFGNLSKRTGMGGLDELAEFAGDITGKNGAVSTRLAQTVEPLKIDLGDLRKVADDAMINRGITGSAKKEILENVKNQSVKAYGGSQGSLASVVGGKDALAAQRFFAESGATAKQGFKRSGNVLDKQKADVYNDLSKQINDRVYSAPGAAERFAGKGGARDRIVKNFNDAAEAAAQNGDKKAVEAYKRLGAEFSKVKDIAGARTFQRDFVNIGKIADKTAEAAQGAGAQLGDNMQGIGRLFQKPTNIIAVPANALTPKVGEFASRWGRRLQGTADGAAEAVASGGKALTRKDLIKSLAAQGVPRAMLGGLGGGGGEEALTPEMSQALMGGVDPSGLTPEQLTAAGITDPSAAQSGAIPKENLDAALIQAATSGDADNVRMLLSLSEYFYPSGAASTTAAQQKNNQTLATTNSAVDQLETLLGQTGRSDSGIGALVSGNVQKAGAAVGLNDNAKIYDQVTGALVTQLARSIGGESGTLTDQDIKRAQGLVPQLTDSKTVQQQKLNLIRQQLATAASANNQPSSANLSSVFGGAY